jgi:ubiquinone/menaquinone biosynthesis C-methylase UbiE
MNEHVDRYGAYPTWLLNLKYACPVCRHPLELTEGSRCGICGFDLKRPGGIYSFATTARANDDWHRVFDELAAGRDGDTSAANEYRSPLQQRYIAAAFRRMCGNIPQDARVLEVGCGNGIFWQSLLGDQPIVGIDYSLAMCARAVARGITAFHADATNLPFGPEQFDLVYSAEVLQYIDDIPAFCAELARVCRPGGRIVVSTLNRTSLLRRAARIARRFKPHPVAARAAHPMISRTAKDFVAGITDLPLAFDEVCWTHFPVPWQRHSVSASSILDPLASNFVIRLIKKSG